MTLEEVTKLLTRPFSIKLDIFLHNDFTVKIGDFGLATVKSQWKGTEQCQQPTGSLLWMAPEVIRMNEKNPFTFQSDVYAYGIVLYELGSGQLPYNHISNRDMILFQVGRGWIKPDIKAVKKDMPKAFVKLIQDTSAFNRDNRPLFKEVISFYEFVTFPLKQRFFTRFSVV